MSKPKLSHRLSALQFGLCMAGVFVVAIMLLSAMVFGW
jgi:hypothetical protein